MTNLARELESTQAELSRLRHHIKQLESDRESTATKFAVYSRLAAIGEVCAGVTHELNNPLSVILGFSQSLVRQAAKDPSMADPLLTIEREASRCKRLVQELLAFARTPQPGKSREDLTDVIEGALCLVETQARFTQVEIVRRCANNLPMATINRHQLQQMLINLCTNALDAMPGGGRLIVETSCSGKIAGKQALEIRVTDTGTGIPSDIRNRIFEPFFTTKEPGKGTGLGLSLAQKIVKDHQGIIEVESTSGKGTVFRIRLPLQASTNPEPVRPPSR